MEFTKTNFKNYLCGSDNLFYPIKLIMGISDFSEFVKFSRYRYSVIEDKIRLVSVLDGRIMTPNEQYFFIEDKVYVLGNDGIDSKFLDRRF